MTWNWIVIEFVNYEQWTKSIETLIGRRETIDIKTRYIRLRVRDMAQSKHTKTVGQKKLILLIASNPLSLCNRIIHWSIGSIVPCSRVKLRKHRKCASSRAGMPLINSIVFFSSLSSSTYCTPVSKMQKKTHTFRFRFFTLFFHKGCNF